MSGRNKMEQRLLARIEKYATAYLEGGGSHDDLVAWSAANAALGRLHANWGQSG